MEKKIIIVAKSKKGFGYCVVGIDKETKQLIRLVSSDNISTNELTEEYMSDSNNSKIEVLDVITVKLIKHLPNKNQPENWLIDKSYKPIKTDEICTSELNDYISKENCIYINKERTLDEITINEIKHSVSIFKINKLRLYKNDYGKIKAYFMYKNIEYKNFTVTDTQFDNIQNTQYIGDAFIVVTIPANPSEYNALYYKIIAQIFPIL